MEFSFFCKKIKLPDSGIELINHMKMPQNEYEELRSFLDLDRPLFFKKVMEKENFKQWFLYLYCHFAWDTYEEYTKRGISEDIYFDTFSDISIWLQTCRKNYKEDGIMEYDWLWRHVQLKLFRLGRLQFELLEAEEDFRGKETTITKGQEIISVHIPEGGSLKESECLKSFEMAEKFFPHIAVFLCHSWLLFPGLKEILPKESNIIKFQKLFEIIDVDFDSREAEERIYIKTESNPIKYPENTSLQKCAKAYLMDGKKLGSGVGIKYTSAS